MRWPRPIIHVCLRGRVPWTVLGLLLATTVLLLMTPPSRDVLILLPSLMKGVPTVDLLRMHFGSAAILPANMTADLPSCSSSAAPPPPPPPPPRRFGKARFEIGKSPSEKTKSKGTTEAWSAPSLSRRSQLPLSASDKKLQDLSPGTLLHDMSEGKDPWENAIRAWETKQLRSDVHERFMPALDQYQKSKLLHIYKVMARALEAAGVEFFLVGGSLLGVHRHHGLIPWDDDIDVAVSVLDWDTIRHALGCIPGFRLEASAPAHWKLFQVDDSEAPSTLPPNKSVHSMPSSSSSSLSSPSSSSSSSSHSSSQKSPHPSPLSYKSLLQFLLPAVPSKPLSSSSQISSLSTHPSSPSSPSSSSSSLPSSLQHQTLPVTAKPVENNKQTVHQRQDRKTRYPFVDLFFYAQDEYYVWAAQPYLLESILFPLDDVFPLARGEFESMIVPVPRRTERIVRRGFIAEECASPSMDHRLHRRREVARIPCSELSYLYPMFNLS